MWNESTITIKNDLLNVSVKLVGAELNSIKKDEVHYLWQRSTGWNGLSPVLFPVIGTFPDNQYKYKDQTYTMKNHGFANIMMFEPKIIKDDFVLLMLSSNDESRSIYPFDFEFSVSYRLVGNELQVGFQVDNTGNETMWFSVGGHPGFNCPLLPGEAFEDYYLEFGGGTGAYALKEHLFRPGDASRLDDGDIINVSSKVFNGSALIFKNLDVNSIALKSRKNNRSVTLNFDGFPYLGLWSPSNAKTFVCIEPWQGTLSSVSGDISEREGIMSLATGETYKCSYSIIIE